ncbi:diaminopimelate decarboxylase [Skermanella stibiiresistens SB22]|uniref:ornithine decarboxylase n=1 Tax=Skermanella stibiiresistens SB22 TaxID=1385369 RepID=W9HC12_9PROT|nr:type III PLP-dependent enzyme [Skermanella stibiiresistens]EWY42227.1 diaminopimelate decarboxylase [Skermanella stibiiresistens SB22]
MAHVRFRSAVSPLRRGTTLARRGTPSVRRPLTCVDNLVETLRPVDPVHCLRPAVLSATAARFVSAFPGDVLYAVKCNPEPAVMRALYEGGIRHFDAASPGEVRLVRQMFSDAEIHYMHPVKSPDAIHQAYFDYGVRDFSLDSAEELEKLMEQTEQADDLGLFIRLALPKGSAVYDLSGKFGAAPAEAAKLLRAARAVSRRIGICFHVGSQSLDPAAYERALELAGTVIEAAGVEIDVMDVGGGFPVSYPGVTPPPLDDFMAAIARGFAHLGLPSRTRLWCEPGRALVAPGVSLVVQVIKRRGDELFINDGVYGSLSDAGVPAFRFPARMIRPEADGQASDDRGDVEEVGFSFYGPTCDSADHMVGPFMLPADIKAGDWIELGQLGAYGSCLRTAFNGFDNVRLVDVTDRPLLETPGYLEQEVQPEGDSDWSDAAAKSVGHIMERAA